MSVEAYTESLFVDSGAHSLYNLFVLKHDKKSLKGKHGRELARPKVRWSQGDFSYYDLTKGSPFREYCDAYARFMRAMEGYGVLLANVDAISNPDLTWEIQRFFEEEHGVHPVPIVHYGTPMKYVDRYLEAGRYDLLGVGGLGQGVSRNEYFAWGDQFFMHICPEKNRFLPVIKTHGFAMTSWELICRWPWWSVDSATWVKLSAYGWLYVPRWAEGKGWRFDRPPMMINFSIRPGEIKEAAGVLPRENGVSPRQMERMKHFTNITPETQKVCLKWIEHLGLEMGSIDKKGEVKVFGVSSHHRARSIANLNYLKALESSRPKWPHPLDPSIVELHAVEYSKGFGL